LPLLAIMRIKSPAAMLAGSVIGWDVPSVAFAVSAVV
jgi:hypothetical protein